MQDVFYEQLIKRELTGLDKVKRLALIFMVAATFVIAMSVIPMFGMFVAVGVGFLAYILIGRLKKEYEYIYTNGELDIDVIFNKSSRKRVFTGHVRDFELMAHVEDSSHQNSFASVNEKHDYSTGVTSERSYTFIANYNNKRMAITIEPNKEMMDVISKALTRRKFYPKK